MQRCNPEQENVALKGLKGVVMYVNNTLTPFFAITL
jgi:hypothetical protein